jgi:hypothetical protein
MKIVGKFDQLAIGKKVEILFKYRRRFGSYKPLFRAKSKIYLELPGYHKRNPPNHQQIPNNDG